MATTEQAPRQATTLVAIFEQQAARTPQNTAARTKQDGSWRDISWANLGADARALADGLASLGIQGGDRVAILGSTSLDWIRADLGVLGSGAVEVPIYQSDKPDEIEYICRDAQVKYLICDTRAQASKVLEVRASLPQLLGALCFEPGGDDVFEKTVANAMALGRK